MNLPLYKVLSADGKSCHGGDLQWSLPTADGPGDWMEAHWQSSEPTLCKPGLIHLTTDPLAWYKPGARVYFVEPSGEPVIARGQDKLGFRRVRLMREITLAEPMIEAHVRLWCFLLAAAKERGEIDKINLSGANLSDAFLSGADLSGANLSGANLSRAFLSGADLSGANLSGADLSGANLSRADLSGANLSRAFLSRANLSGATHCSCCPLDPRLERNEDGTVRLKDGK